MSISFDFSDVMALAADLGDAEAKVIPNVRKAVEVTARHIKDDSKKTANRTGLKRYAASIDYDMKLDTNGEVGAEIGPNMDKAMGTFGFVEDAPDGVQSAPQHALRKAAHKNQADFIKGLEQAIGDVL